jgi:hypothetical protein
MLLNGNCIHGLQRKLFALAMCAALAVAIRGESAAQSDSAQAAPRHSVQRLYLRDGTYQNVTEYHLAGDHVHYYSADRAAWEDVPMAMVDLAATQKWNAERDQAVDKQRTARAAERDSAEADVRRQLDKAQPEVAANLRLPEKGDFWGLDEYQGKAALIPMVQPAAEKAARERAHGEAEAQAKAESKKERKNPSQLAQNEATARTYEANAAMQPPLAPDAKNAGSDAGNGNEVRLAGTRPRREFHVAAPTFYVRAGVLPDAKFVLVRMQQDFKHQERVLGAPPADALAGGSGKGFAAVKVETMPGGKWQKITMTADLPIGDYALVRILNARQWDAHVWDFDIDPSAAENGEAVTAATEK